MLPLQQHGLSRKALRVLAQRRRPHSKMLDEGPASEDPNPGGRQAEGVAEGDVESRLASFLMALDGQPVRHTTPHP